jgi:hypothetical protein
MKIEIELDVERIHKEVVERLVAILTYEAKILVDSTVKALIISEIRTQTQQQARDIIAALELPDGRTFKQYIVDLLTKPAPYSERPKILEYVERTAVNEAQGWWKAVFEQHMPALKESMLKHMMDLTMSAVMTHKSR